MLKVQNQTLFSVWVQAVIVTAQYIPVLSDTWLAGSAAVSISTPAERLRNLQLSTHSCLNKRHSTILTVISQQQCYILLTTSQPELEHTKLNFIWTGYKYFLLDLEKKKILSSFKFFLSLVEPVLTTITITTSKGVWYNLNGMNQFYDCYGNLNQIVWRPWRTQLVSVTLKRASMGIETLSEEVRASNKALTVLNVETKWLSSFQQKLL
jgi:hypothetical protein